MPSQFGGIPYNPEEDQAQRQPASKFGGIPYTPESDQEAGAYDIQREYTPTDEIDVRTGQPKTEWTPRGQESPAMSTYFKQMFVDDPQTKLEIYSKARFPDLSEEERQSRYSIQGGEVIFRGDDGKWYPETPEDFLSQAKKFISSEALRPSNITTGAGAFAAGLPGAAAGGAVGEGVRKLVGSAVFGEPQTYTQNLIDVTTEALVGGLSEGIANKLFVGIPNKYKMRKGRDLMPAVKKDLERGFIKPEDHARAEVIKNMAESYNIKLAPHQLYDKESMTNIWKYLRKHPQTSNAVKEFDDQLSASVEAATEQTVKDISGPNRQGPFALGSDIQDASRKAILTADQERSAAVKGLYDEALSKPGNPETMQGLIRTVDQLIEDTADTPPKNILKNVKKSLMVDGAADTNLKRLQEARWAIDDLLDGSAYEAKKVDPSIKKALNRKLTIIKDQLTRAMDEPTGGLYSEANRKFQELSPPIDRMRKSVLGEIDRMKADGQLSKLPRKFLSPAAMTDPDLLKEALTAISKESPDFGNRIAGGYIRDVFESLKATEGGNIANVAGKMHKALFGSKKQQDLLEAALSPRQYNNLKDLMTVFKRAAIGSGSESITAGFQAIEKDLSKSAGGKVAQLGQAAFSPLQSAKEAVFDRWNDLIVMGNQERLLSALKSDQATRLIRKMKPLKPGTQKFLRTTGTILNLLIARAGGQHVDKLTSDNYPIRQIRPE